MFPLKNEVDYYSWVIYKGYCSCGQNYIGVRVCNAEIRWNDHEDKKIANHLIENPNYTFILTLSVVSVPRNYRKRKVIAAYFIKTIFVHLKNS